MPRFYRFEDRCIIYFLHDKGDRLIYVGKSTQGTARCLNHKDKPWEYADYEKVDPDRLDELEADLIHRLHPPFNGICHKCNHYAQPSATAERRAYQHSLVADKNGHCRGFNAQGNHCRVRSPLIDGFCEYHSPDLNPAHDPGLTRDKIAKHQCW